MARITVSLRDIHPREIKQLVREIPTLPAVYQRLFTLMNDPDVSVPAVADLISRDQALAAKILQLVNSAFYGCREHVTTISRAMMVLGFRTVRNAAMAISVFEYVGGGKAGIDLERLWRHSLAAAGICKVLGPRVGLRQQEDTFIAGLLHDSGKLVIRKYFPRDWDELGNALTVNRGYSWHAAERELFGIDHAMIAKAVFRSWNFPPSLIEAVQFHHSAGTPGTTYPGLVALTHLSDCVAWELDLGGPLGRAPSNCDAAATAELGFTVEDALVFKAQMTEEIEQAMQIIHVIH